MVPDQREDESPLRRSNTTPLNTPVDGIYDPVPSDFLDYFMSRDSGDEASLDSDDGVMPRSEIFASAVKFQEPMEDFGDFMLDLEDESIMDAMYYSMVGVDDESLSDSRNHSAIELEGECMQDKDEEPVLDLEPTAPVVPLDEDALEPTASTGTISPKSEAVEKSQRQLSAQEKAKRKGKGEQEASEETMEIKLLRAESTKEKLMYVIRDLEKVIADKEHDCKQAEAELDELASKFRDAQHRTHLREAYVEQMHAHNQEMIHEKKLSEVEKIKLEREMQCEIDRQKERNSHIQTRLEKAIEGVRDMFDAHTNDHENRVEAAEFYQETVEDQNERLLWFLQFMEDTEDYVWRHQIPGKEVVYEAEVNLLRNRTVDWSGTPPATDYHPNSNQLAMRYPRESDEISDDYATSNDDIAFDTPKSDVSGAYKMMDASWSSDEISNDYTSGSVSNFHLTFKGNHKLETRSIRLSEEDFEVGADGEYIVPEAEVDADEDTDLQILKASPAEKESPLTSPLSIRPDGDYDIMDINKPFPYLARLPPLSPPSKRICLGRLRELAWDSPARDHSQGQVLFQERLTAGQPCVKMGVRQPSRPLFGIPGGGHVSPDSPTAMPRAAREDLGWSLSIGNYFRARISGSSSEETDGAYVEGNMIIYSARLWKAFTELATLQECVMAAIRMIMMCMMMWLAYHLRAYDEWKLANDEPTTLETILETMNGRMIKIGLVDTARFGIHEWLEERTWIG